MERTEKRSLPKIVIVGLALFAVLMVVGCTTGGTAREEGFYAAHNQGKTSDSLGIGQRLIATRADTAGYFDVLEGTWAPGGVFGNHTHDFDEFYYIEEGEIAVDYGDRVVNAVAGAFFFFPEGQKHAMTNTSSTEDLKIIIFFAPSFGNGYGVVMDELAKLSTADPDYGAMVGKIMEETGKTTSYP